MGAGSLFDVLLDCICLCNFEFRFRAWKMSWYQAVDGRNVWVPREETVYTVIRRTDELPLEDLQYVSLAPAKPVFKEHLVNDDSWDIGRNKKRNRRRAGKERGFVLRVESEEHARVVPWFKTACKQLLIGGACRRIDADEAVNLKKQKKKYERGVNIGANECRVESVSRSRLCLRFFFFRICVVLVRPRVQGLEVKGEGQIQEVRMSGR